MHERELSIASRRWPRDLNIISFERPSNTVELGPKHISTLGRSVDDELVWTITWLHCLSSMRDLLSDDFYHTINKINDH